MSSCAIQLECGVAIRFFLRTIDMYVTFILDQFGLLMHDKHLISIIFG